METNKRRWDRIVCRACRLDGLPAYEIQNHLVATARASDRHLARWRAVFNRMLG
jgi:hypothetical protein